MFKPSNPKVVDIAKRHQPVIHQLERLLPGKVNIYIDYANVRAWTRRLQWHIDIERLYQFLRSFDNFQTITFYNGTLQGKAESETFMKRAANAGYRIRTKPVKIMRFSIDATSISPSSPDLLVQFIRNSLLRELDLKTIELLNSKLQELFKIRGPYLEERKCNFDVEIGRDMTIDNERGAADCFGLWSGDSDFHDPVNELLSQGKKVVLFATARRVASELQALQRNGLFIFDIAKIRDFICYQREMAG